MSRFGTRVRRGVQHGATLYLAPATGSYASGATITMTIRMSSGSVGVNAVQANLTYPTAQLQFVSTSTAGSPFTTTIQNSGGSGSVQLGVGILAGSTSGDQLVGTVTFTALNAGSAAVSFAAGSGIAKASDSTDICQQKRGALYTIA